MYICKYMKPTMGENRSLRYVCPYKKNEPLEIGLTFKTNFIIPRIKCPEDVKLENGAPVCFIMNINEEG